MFSKMGHKITVIVWNLIGFDIAGNFTLEELSLLKQIRYYPALNKRLSGLFDPKKI